MQNQTMPFSADNRLSPKIPPFPNEDAWTFVKELQAPLHDRPVIWESKNPNPGEIDLRAGVKLDFSFPDPHGLLETMHADFRLFLQKGGISETGDYRIITEQKDFAEPETYSLEVTSNFCKISAADTEGIRRGLVYLEDELLRRAGPFLKPGQIEKKPLIKTRLSRCFFGPIKRPPKNRDELLDDVDYYPAEYLNRLAHDGVNGLWLTVEWKDLVPTEIFPGTGGDAERRFAKLKRTIAKCARYGIKIYIFCIEPAAIPFDSPILKKHPELSGRSVGQNFNFCISSPTGIKYVEDTTRAIFTKAPGLGGMLVISIGERPTHCYSGGLKHNTCPRCSKRQPREVLADTLAAMQRGMHSVNPKAELISWPYSQYLSWGADLTIDSAAHIPEGVILQHNFESDGRAKQLGRMRYLSDYWLAYIGPSSLYRSIAKRAVEKGTRVSAKLQVGCSHEVATVPYVPVPGNLYEKYKAMWRLGVSSAMYGWYFGTYPSLMTRAAGELAFTPTPKSETEFLTHLARRDWGKHSACVVDAWQHFQDGYQQFPYAVMAGYYAPCHDGPVWPLYLLPRDLPLAPTWQIKYGVSGDRIGEMICYYHTAREFQTLLTEMSKAWNRGLKLLLPLREDCREQSERLRDIGVAEALGIQFESAKNIIDFYLLREELPNLNPSRQKKTLVALSQIVSRELELDKRLLELVETDSRLGFHSEAEAHKYHPELIRWRMDQLRTLLKTEFKAVEKQIAAQKPLFEGYIRPAPKDTVYLCQKLTAKPKMNGRPIGEIWDDLPGFLCEALIKPPDPSSKHLADTEHFARKTVWKTCYDETHLYVGILCDEPEMERLLLPDDDNKLVSLRSEWWNNDSAGLIFEPRRLWPAQTLLANAAGARWQRWRSVFGSPWKVSGWRGSSQWSLIFQVPLNWIAEDLHKKKLLRVNVIRIIPHEKVIIRAAPFNPWPTRLALGGDNPQDLIWLRLV